jgi:pimeloyl-ACP methyl ester carboxylesterase
MSRANLIFLVICGAAWLLLHQLIAVQNRALVVEDRSQYGGASLINIRPAGRVAQTLPVKVLLIHGLSASKSAMRQMAAELARWGSDCYLIDLPGHGDSPERFSLQATVSTTDQAVRELLSSSNNANSSSPPLVVIGHSFGARVALGAAQRHPRIAAVIALSPAAESFAPKAMVPLLIVIGAFDFPFVRRGAAFLYEQVTSARLPRLDGPGQWQNSTGSSRLVVLPWTDHSQTLFKASSLHEIKIWLTKVSPTIAEVPFSPWAFWARTQLRAVFCILSLLIWFPVVALLVNWVMPGVRKPSSNPFIGAPEGRFTLVGVYAFAAPLAAVFLLWMNPWGRLGLMGGDYLAGLLCATGVVGLAVLRPEWKSAGDEWKALLCSLLAWVILVAVCSPWITAEFVHLGLNSIRFWRFPWISLSVLPFFVLDEQICRRMLQRLSTARIVMFHLSTRFILAIALLLGFFVLRNGQFLVVLILPGLVLTSLLCWCLAAWIHRKTGSVAASGLFGALATGWFFSVFFAQL